jgi:hypothetical protein
MKHNNYLRLVLLSACGAGILTLSGCGITIATVAGVTAYEVSKSNSGSEAIAKKLADQINNSYFAIATQDKTMVLAGQVPSAADITKAKTLIAKDYSDMTVYSYLVISPPENNTEQEADKALDKKVTKLITSDKTTGVVATSSSGSVYLLANNKTSSKNLEQLADNILQLEGVKNIITVRTQPSK